MTVLDAILKEPTAPQWAARLQAVLAEEAARRTAFRDWLTPEVKAEFINGERVVHSPARFVHTLVMFRTGKLLDAHAQKRQMGRVLVEKALIALTRNDYEPDVCWWSPEKAATFAPETMVFPPPDLVAEVLSESTEANDRGVKFKDYAAHGIAEYWILDAGARTVEQYLLQGDAYALKIKATNGVLESAAVGGMTIPIEAFFDDGVHARALQSIWSA